MYGQRREIVGNVGICICLWKCVWSLAFSFFMCMYVCVLHLVWLNWSVTCEPEKEIVQNKEQRLVYLALENFSAQFGLVLLKMFSFGERSDNKESVRDIPSSFLALLRVFVFFFVFVVFWCVCHLEWLKWKGERRSCASYLSAVKNWRSRGRETKREEKTGIQGGTTGIYKYHAVAEYAWYQMRGQFNVCFYWPSPKRSKNISEVE